MSGRKIVELVLEKKYDDMTDQVHFDLNQIVQEALDTKKFVIAQNYFGQAALSEEKKDDDDDEKEDDEDDEDDDDDKDDKKVKTHEK